MPGFCLARSVEASSPPQSPAGVLLFPSCSALAMVYFSVSRDSPVRSSRQFFSHKKSGRYFPDWKNSVLGSLVISCLLIPFPGWGWGAGIIWTRDRHWKGWLPPFFCIVSVVNRWRFGGGTLV